MSATPPGPGSDPAASPQPGVTSGDDVGESSDALTPTPPAWIATSGPVILDASFVLALLDASPRVQHHGVCLPGSTLLSVNLGEVFAKTASRTHLVPRHGQSVTAQIEHWLAAAGVQLVDLPVAAVHHFPDLVAIDQAARAAAKAAGARRSNLSLGDKSALSYALHTGLPVLTGDRHWAQLRSFGLTVPVYLY